MPTNLVRRVREPYVTSANAPLLVLLHGLGSHEGDLMELAHELNSALRVVTLRAPKDYSAGGFAWFDLQWDERGIRVDPAEVINSLNLLTSELESLREEYGSDKLLLGGFSQGAIMTIGATLLRPDLVQGALSLSGRYIPELFAQAAPGVEKVPFIVQHGVYDQVLPVAGSRSIRDALVGIGANVKYYEYPMAHEVSWASLQDASAWIDQRV